jgi:hypothetical protein
MASTEKALGQALCLGLKAYSLASLQALSLRTSLVCNRKEKLNMNIKDLVGYQLVSINDNAIVVRKGDSEYTIQINEDYGDCCGYNEINTKLLVSEDELVRNPIITNVEMEIDSSDASDGWGNSAKITFFGEVKPIAEMDSFSSSGSGWGYGACVTIVCEALEMNEVVTSW